MAVKKKLKEFYDAFTSDIKTMKRAWDDRPGDYERIVGKKKKKKK